ncbi:MAG: cysteine dioxygenase family protein [Actinomycetota bacterium]|nr:cysteine dioxygenase family protein [Actinomycetota bacterium]MDQ2956116.1 cysteine dioxygenase family protein [Actinomycetota bacterium]
MIVAVEKADYDGAEHAEPLLQQADGLSLDELPGRKLERRELIRLVSALGADEARWRSEVAFSDDTRHYVSLYRDEHVDVWLLCWTPSNDTGWHDHDQSSGAVAVLQGELVEHNLLIGRPSLATAIPAGQTYCFGPEHIHRLTGLAPGSVSIHAYSPPLSRLGQYTVGAGGVLRRVSVSYVDELRPLDDMI